MSAERRTTITSTMVVMLLAFCASVALACPAYAETTSGLTVGQAGEEANSASSVSNDEVSSPAVPKTYKIIYKLNGGKQAKGQVMTLVQSSSAKVSKLKKPTRANFKFVGWYTDKKLMKKAERVWGVSSAKKRTLYAKWVRVSYKIVYKLNGGEFSGSHKKNLKIMRSINASQLAKPVRNGYTFKGWFANSSLTRKATKLRGVSSASMRTVYAKWKTKTYRIIYNPNGGSMPAKYATTYKTAKGLASLPIPTRPGYAFIGWCSDSDMTTFVTKLPKGSYGKLKLRACWLKRTLIAHRGYHVSEIENSYHAYIAAAKKGFTRAETDIRFTADDEPILMHDARITLLEEIEVPVDPEPIEEDATVSGDSDADASDHQVDGDSSQSDEPSEDAGDSEPQTKIVTIEHPGIYVNSMNLAELQVSKIKNHPISGLEGRNFTTFEEFISVCKDYGIVPNIELKEGTPEQLKKLVDIVDAYGMANNVVWSSFHKEQLYAVSELVPTAQYQLLENEIPNFAAKLKVARKLRDAGGDVTLSISANMPAADRKTYIKKCKAIGMPLGIHQLANDSSIPKLNAYYSSFSIDALLADPFPNTV